MPHDELGKLYDDEIAEYCESEASIAKKAQLLATAIRESNYCVFFTGAGVSTSASIPDYRGSF